MDQIQLEKKEDMHNCKICTQTFKSKAGLQYHMQKIHPLDLTSGLSCFICNKNFTQRYLIENHYRTVRHQIECRKYMEEERVKRTSRNYQKMLLKMNNFRYRPYTEKLTNLRSTPIEIPLKSSTELPGHRLEKSQKKKRTLNMYQILHHRKNWKNPWMKTTWWELKIKNFQTQSKPIQLRILPNQLWKISIFPFEDKRSTDKKLS